MLTMFEALERLKETGITESIQVLRKWIREGKIKAEKTDFRKEGYRIHEEDLEQFIEERNPLYREVKQLRKENADLKKALSKAESKEQMSNKEQVEESIVAIKGFGRIQKRKGNHKHTLIIELNYDENS